jgi:hypothetical protein
MTTYRVGDAVRIREDLCGCEHYNGLFCNDDMARHRGESAIITAVRNVDRYKIDVDDGAWSWNGTMFWGLLSDEQEEPFDVNIDDLF